MNAEGRIAFLMEVKNNVKEGLRAAMGEMRNFTNQVKGGGSGAAQEWDKVGHSIIRMGTAMAIVRGSARALEAAAAAMRGDFEKVKDALREIPFFGSGYRLGESIIDFGAATAGKGGKIGGFQALLMNNIPGYGKAVIDRMKDLKAEENAAKKLAEWERERAELQTAIAARTMVRELTESAKRDAITSRLTDEFERQRQQAEFQRQDALNKNQDAFERDYVTRENYRAAKEAILDAYKAKLQEIERARLESELRAEQERRERWQRFRDQTEREAEKANQDFIDSRREVREREKRIAQERAQALNQNAPLIELTNTFRGVALGTAQQKEQDSQVFKRILAVVDDIARRKLNPIGGVAVELR